MGINVTVEEAGPCRKDLNIEVSADEVTETMAEVVTAVGRAAKIPGFRPGKAPAKLVRSRYAKQIAEEVKDRLVPRGYQEAIKKENIEAVGILNVEEVTVADGEPLRFKVTVDVPPAFDLPEYKGIKLEGESVEVSDEEVGETIDGLLEQRARFEDVEGRPVQTGDLAQIDYEGVCDGKPVEEIAPESSGLGKAEDFWVRVDENALLPEFGEQIPGMEVGERKQIFANFAEDFQDAALAGKQVSYFVQVKALREKKLPEIDEEFLKTFAVESEDELRSKVKSDLLAMKSDGERRRLKNEVVRALMATTTLDVPESVVQEATRGAIYDMVRESRARGARPEDIESRREEIFNLASRNATERVKARYILLRIADQEGFKASDEDIAGRIQAMAASYGMKEEELRANLKKREQLAELAEDIQIDKTTDFLVEHAQVSS